MFCTRKHRNSLTRQFVCDSRAFKGWRPHRGSLAIISYILREDIRNHPLKVLIRTLGRGERGVRGYIISGRDAGCALSHTSTHTVQYDTFPRARCIFMFLPPLWRFHWSYSPRSAAALAALLRSASTLFMLKQDIQR